MSQTASIYSIDNDSIRARWKSLEVRNVLASPFATLTYMEALSVAMELPLRAVLCSRNGEDEAGLLFLEGTRAGISYTVPFSFTPFSAVAATAFPTSAQVHAGESWMDSLQAAVKNDVSDIDLRLHPGITDIRPFQWASWQTTPLYTYSCALSTDTEVRPGWSENTRRLFEKHEQKYQISDASEFLEDVNELCLSGYTKRRKSPPLPADRLNALVSSQIDQGQARCFSLQDMETGIVAAGIILLGNAPEGYYWIAGSTPGPAMTVLLGKLFERLRFDRYTRFDFVGANTPSIAEFKRRFDPSLVPYFRVRSVPNPILRIFLSLRDSFRSKG